MLLRSQNPGRHAEHRNPVSVWARFFFLIGTLAVVSGCTVVSGRLSKDFAFGNGKNDDSLPIGERAEAASRAARVSNPPAQQIRFDGQERLLGGGNCEALPTSQLLDQVRSLHELKKFRSAITVVQLHRRSARRLLLEQAGHAHQPVMSLVAATLDESESSALWIDLLAECGDKAGQAKQWQSLVSDLKTPDRDAELQASTINALTELAQQFQSPLCRIEVLRLTGEFQVASEQTPQAIESLVTAAELAARVGSSSLAADLWLMTCEASLRVDEVQQARKCWKAAVSSQLMSIHARGANQPLPTIDSVFWEQVMRLAHPSDELPKELVLALAPWYSRMGIQFDDSLRPDVALWAAIADYQLATGQPHIASLSIKRAETHASEQARPFLQIALARAMAAQGQQSVATTILGPAAESDNPNIRASALAVLGAMKVQSGAYEQGGRFLSQALSIGEASEWPGRLAAKADLANVRLILGRLDDALPALHEVQLEMLAAKKWQSLCYSLSNEASILELEGRTKEASQIRARIDEIERVGS